MMALRSYQYLQIGSVLAAVLALGACDLLDSPLASTKDKVVTANQEVLTLVETARLGAYSSKSTFNDTATTYGGIIAKLKSASLDLTPASEDNPRASLVAVIDACAARVAALSEQHRRFGLNPKGAYQVTTNDCRLAEIAVKEDI